MKARKLVIEQIAAFRRSLQDAVAERTEPFAHGTGLFCDSLPTVYDANFLRVDTIASAEEHATEADTLMEPFWHRRVLTDGDGAALAHGFAELGWTQTTHVVMGHVRSPDRRVDVSAVREVPLDSLVEAQRRVTLGEPHGTIELADALLATKRRVVAAVPTRFFAITAAGEVASYCELRSDGHTAQIEDVNTLPAFRGRGLGRAVVQHALDEAVAANKVVFIEALADDWPKELYARLGFETLAERHLFLRPPHPLSRLRIRTPRLELRLATVAELRELYRMARAGIHDPGFMPFGDAWTDTVTEESFLDWHLSALRDWRPYDWRLRLVVFHDGRPIGAQDLTAKQFGATRRASTGSWLGTEWQRRGLGTEMRGAVLTLLFDRLGGREAASGAIAGNDASLGVSRKLGYERVGVSTVAPRGVVVEHQDLLVTRERFRRPTGVTIDGLEGLDSLFGVDW
jgi:RimJ/RimL family protein N-acetyltransferase/ribosomal protein S18 acetylase RimI-like enzyme